MSKPSLLKARTRIKYARAAGSALRVQRFMLEDNFYDQVLCDKLTVFVDHCLTYIKDNL